MITSVIASCFRAALQSFTKTTPPLGRRPGLLPLLLRPSGTHSCIAGRTEDLHHKPLGAMASAVIQVALALLAAASVCPAQTYVAALQGRVVDPSGASVAGASVRLEDPSRSLIRVSTSDDGGLFVFANLAPRAYRVTTSNPGFQTWQSEVILNAGDTRTLSVELVIGRVEDRVTVSAAAPDLTSALATSVDKNLVDSLPLNGRTFQALVVLTPGVVSAAASFETQGQFSVNGQRTSTNYFTIDGVSANFAMSSAVRPAQTASGALPALSVAGTTGALLPLEAIQEFKIQTSAYAAEYGRQPGAQVQITSLSGGNAYHGSLYDYFRNDKLDAADWFANRNRLFKPPLRQNNFGAVVGGRIVRNRTFFLATYEGLDLQQPRTATVTVPDANTRSHVPSVLAPYVNAIAQPNGAAAGNGLALFNASYSDPTRLHAASVRLDHAFNSRLQAFGRFNHGQSRMRTRQTSGYAPNTVQVDQNRIWTLTMGLTAMLTPEWTADTRFNVSNMEAATREEVDSFGGAAPLAESVLYPSFTNRSESAFFFQMSQGVGFVDGNISRNKQRQYNWTHSLSRNRTRHQTRLGLDVRWLQPRVHTRNFDTVYSFADPAALITGVARTAGVRGWPVVDYAYSNYSVFAQDQYRLTPCVTLTYGLRWEMNPGPSGRNGYKLYPIVGTYPNFTVGSPDEPFYATTKRNFAPRLGLAWQVRDSAPWGLILRTGTGVFYDLGAGMSGSLSDNLYQRTRTSANVVFPLSSTVLVPIPIPATAPYSIVTTTDPNLKLPYSLHWNVSFEQSLGRSQTLQAGYVGSEGERLLQTQFYLNPNSSFQQLRFIRNAAESNYHALQLRFQRRLGETLQTLVSYTWSHSIDNTSGDDVVYSPPAILNSHTDRGASDFDVRHVFNAGLTWRLRLHTAGPRLRRIANGWSVDPVWRYQSAPPVTPYETRVFPGLSGSIRTRPDLVAGVPLYLESNNYAGGRALNPSAFRQITDARQGTLGRNVLRAFPLTQLDLSLRRDFAVGERLRLQFLADAYNLFNHPCFAAPVLDVNNALFGMSQQNYGSGLGAGGVNGGINPLYQVGTPRSLQFALKLRF
jgi:hypothetical protein